MVDFSKLTPYSLSGEKSAHKLGIEYQGALRGMAASTRSAAEFLRRSSIKTVEAIEGDHVYQLQKKAVLYTVTGGVSPKTIFEENKMIDLKKKFNHPYHWTRLDCEKQMNEISAQIADKHTELQNKISKNTQLNKSGAKALDVYAMRALKNEYKIINEYTWALAKRGTGQKIFRISKWLAGANVIFTGLQIKNALSADSVAGAGLLNGKQIWRTLGEIGTGEIAARVTARLLPFPVAIAAGYLGTVYGGRLADAGYDYFSEAKPA